MILRNALNFFLFFITKNFNNFLNLNRNFILQINMAILKTFFTKQTEHV